MGRHALRLLRLLRWWCQSRATLSCAAGHDATEEVAGPMSDLWWLRLRRPKVRALAGATAGLEFALELGDSVLVSTIRQMEEPQASARVLTLLSSGCAAARASRPCRG